MQDSSLGYICSLHQQKAIQINLDSSTSLENKFICQICIDEKLQKSKILKVQDAQSQLQEMKSDIQKKMNNIIEQKLIKLQSLTDKLYQSKESMQLQLNKLIELINQRIYDFRMKQSESEATNNIQMNENAITQLSYYLEQDRQADLSEWITQQNESEIEFVKIIHNQLDQLNNSQIFQEIHQELKNLSKYDSQNNESNIEQEIQKKIKLTPKKINCAIHAQNDYCMVSLSKGYIEERLFCLECLEDQQNQNKLKTFKNFNKQWEDYLEIKFKYESQNYLSRQQNLVQKQQLSTDISEQQQQLSFQIQKLIKEQKLKIDSQLNQVQLSQKNSLSIYKMDINQLREAANTLANQECLLQQEQLQLQQKLKDEDENLQEEIKKKLDSLQLTHHRLKCILMNENFVTESELFNQNKQLKSQLDEAKSTIQKISLIIRILQLYNNNQAKEQKLKYEQLQNDMNSKIEELNTSNQSILEQLKQQLQNNQIEFQRVQNDNLKINEQLQSVSQNEQKVKAQFEEYQKLQQSQLDLLQLQLAHITEKFNTEQQANKDCQNLIDQLKNQNEQQIIQQGNVLDENKRLQQLVSQYNLDKDHQNDSELKLQCLDIFHKLFENKINPRLFLQNFNLYITQQPIALLLGNNDKTQLQIMKTLFQNQKINLYQKYYEENNQIFVVNTDQFDFDDIDEREKQIKEYRELFRKNHNKFAVIWIAVQFEKTDIMKKKAMDIYKFIHKLKIPISFIIADFHLSDNKIVDEQHIRSRFTPTFKPKDYVFFGKNINKEQFIKDLQKTLPQLNEFYCFPMELKDTIFEDESYLI